MKVYKFIKLTLMTFLPKKKQILMNCGARWISSEVSIIFTLFTGNCCRGNHTEVIWRPPYELHWMHQRGLQIYKKGVILWYIFFMPVFHMPLA
jgi:hypothetical protein